MNDYLIYLPLEAFLAQWFRHRHGAVRYGEDSYGAVRLVRGSVESKRLKALLDVPPSDYVPHPAPKDCVAVAIPSFPAKDPRQFNYVSPQGIAALVETIRDLFDLEIYDYYVKTYVRGSRIDYMIEAWMAKNCIEYNDTNYNSVKKRLDRVRNKVYVQRYRDKSKEKSSENP